MDIPSGNAAAWSPEVIATYHPSFAALPFDRIVGSSPVYEYDEYVTLGPRQGQDFARFKTIPAPTAALSLSIEAAYHAFQNRVTTRIALASQLLNRRKHTLQLAASNIATLCATSAASTSKNIHGVGHCVATAALDVVHNCMATLSAAPGTLIATRSKPKTLDQTTAQSYLFAPEERETIVQQTTQVLQNVQYALRQDDLWELINEHDGVKVWRTFENIKKTQSASSSPATNDVAVIRSEAILNSSPQKVFQLLMDNSRVHEYNENCVELYDIEYLNSNTKINWCATGKFGPFKARDFVTVVHFRELEGESNGGYVSLAANIEHSKLPPTSSYVRSQIQLAATFMMPVPGQPNKTKFVQVTQVGQLGGVADSRMAKKITQNLAEKAPVDFVKKFDKALNSAPLPKPNRSANGLPFRGVGSLSEV